MKSSKLFRFNMYAVSLLLALVLLNVHQYAHAVQKPFITISPFLQDIRFNGSDPTKEFPLSITNSSEKSIHFKLNVLDFGSLNDTGGVVFAGSKSSALLTKYGLATWLQLSQNELTIEAGKTTQIYATIINDFSLQPGGHYAAIVASVDNEAAVNLDKISINQKLSSLILATKMGGEKYDLKLDTIETQTSKLHLPKTVMLHFKNPGNVHVVPRGTVKILNSSGVVVSKGIINEDSSYVLPETNRAIAVDMQTMSSGGPWPSLYRLEVDYRYDGFDTFAHKSQTLYFLNYPNLITCIVVLGLSIWLGVRYRIFIRSKINVALKKLNIHVKRPKKSKNKIIVWMLATSKKVFSKMVQIAMIALKKLHIYFFRSKAVVKQKIKNRPKKKHGKSQPVLLWSNVERTSPEKSKRKAKVARTKNAKKIHALHKTAYEQNRGKKSKKTGQ